MRCAEPGCGGTVVDGYCDVCGTAPAPAAPQAVSTARRRALLSRSDSVGANGSYRIVVDGPALAAVSAPGSSRCRAYRRATRSPRS